MSSFVFPTLIGLTFDVSRTPIWHTQKQVALSGKRSTMAYQQYPLIHFELVFSILRDDTAVSDTKALVGLFNAVQGGYDTFLFSDPDFNTAILMFLASTDGVTTSFQITAFYQNPGGPGYGEIIQNFNGAPSIYINRYGPLIELLSAVSRTQLVLQSQTLNVSWNPVNITIGVDVTAAPNGTTTADSLIESTATNVQHWIGQNVTVSASVATFTLSCFVKPSARGWVFIALSEATGSTLVEAWFNISTGVVGSILTGTNWSGTSATISAAGGGWYRVTLTSTKTNAATTIGVSVSAATADAVGTYTGAVSTTAIFVWGVQLETGTQGATMYLPTTTVQVTQLDYTINATGLITTTNTLATAASLLWSGSWYYRCAFDNDQLDLIKFMNKWWSIKKLPFTSVKL